MADIIINFVPWIIAIISTIVFFQTFFNPLISSNIKFIVAIVTLGAWGFIFVRSIIDVILANETYLYAITGLIVVFILFGGNKAKTNNTQTKK